MPSHFSRPIVSAAATAIAALAFAATPAHADHHKSKKPHAASKMDKAAKSKPKRDRAERDDRMEDRDDMREDRREMREEMREDRMEERMERMEERRDRMDDLDEDMDMDEMDRRDRARFEERGLNNRRMNGETGRRDNLGVGADRRMRDGRETDRALPAQAIENSRAPVRVNCPAGTTAQPNGTCLITGDFRFRD